MKFVNIMELKEVQEKKIELVQKFHELKNNQSQLLNLIPSLDEITDWKFGKSSSTVYPIPHSLERWGYKTAPLLKKVYESVEDGSNHNLYSFGFKDNLLIISLPPIINSIPKIRTDIFSYKNNITSRVLVELSPVSYNQNSIIYDDNDPVIIDLEVLEDFITIDSKTKFAMSFNGREEFLAFVYQFNDEGKLISAVFANEKGNPGSESTLNYEYDEKGQLCKVVSPNNNWIPWEKKKK